MALGELYGMLGIAELAADRTYASQVGQVILYDAIDQIFQRYSVDLQRAIRLFVAGQTPDFSYKFKLAGGGRAQRKGVQSRPGVLKQSGEWNVALPLWDYGDSLAEDRITFAYLTVAELDTRINTILIRDTNTYRWEILRAMFSNVNRTFDDELGGALTIRGLANGDSTTFPPIIGSENTLTSHQHYVATGYIVSAISDTNDPFPTAVDHLEEHFGTPDGGANVLFLHAANMTDDLQALAQYEIVQPSNVTLGNDERVAFNIPAGIPGRVHGRSSTDQAWLSEWRWLPDDYAIAIHLDQQAPLRERVDRPETGLGTGLQLVSTDSMFPVRQAIYERRYGLAVQNRLAAVVLHFTAGAYAIPTGFTI